MGDATGQDESAQIHDGVLLVLKAGSLAGPAGAPAGVGINRVQRQPPLRALEVPYSLVLNTLVVHGGIGELEQAVLLDGLLLELGHGQPAGRQPVSTDVSLDQAGVHVHLRRQQAQAHQLLVQSVEDGLESLPANAVDEVTDSGMVEHRVVDGQETEPAVGQIFRYGRAESTEGGDVLQGEDQQGPDQNLGMDHRPAKVGAVSLFQRCGQMGEVQVLVNLDQEMVGVDKVPQLLGGELEQGGVPAATVQRLKHGRPRQLQAMTGL